MLVLAHMVEVQNHYIILPAVYAGMLLEVLHQPDLVLSCDASIPLGYGLPLLVTVDLVVRLEPLVGALSAEVLQPICLRSVPVEV